ncbi:hypothetical protein GGR52DRAFT_569595 [Hypoxylon sp. FL1284]|nr:hypothetical protein GGR52DRAFT_569595 [Hypoxylon sp. FL1284]
MSSSPNKPEGDRAAAVWDLSPRECEIIARAWLCITDVKDGAPVVDSKKLAKLGGYASADSARHMWRPIQNKLTAILRASNAREMDVTPLKAAPAKAAPAKKGRKRTGSAADSEIPETPAKKARRGTRFPGLFKDNEDGEDANLDEGEA